MSGAGELIKEALLSWPGVEAVPHRFGGTEYRYGRKEMGHVHGDRLADLPLPRKLHDEVIAAGRADLHHVLPDTGWVSCWMTGPEDAPRVIDLFRIQYERYASTNRSAPDAGSEVWSGQPEVGKINDVPEVLFVCVHNAGRSQMAAGLLNKRAAGRVNVRSAGSAPAHELNPGVVEAMREVGIDISHEFPKPLTGESVKAADVVVTMGCGDSCPVYPGKRYEDWELDDPAGQDLETIRRIRDEIDSRVTALLGRLAPTQT